MLADRTVRAAVVVRRKTAPLPAIALSGSGHSHRYIRAACFTGFAIVITSLLFKIHEPLIAVVTASVMLTAMVLMWRAAFRKRGPIFFAASLLMMSAAYIGYGGFILPHDSIKDSARRMFDQLPQADTEPNSIILLKPTERISGAARFYARGPVQSVNDYAALMTAWNKNPNALVLMSAADQAGMDQFTIRQKFEYGKEEYWIVVRATPNP
jgi:hypothetical protein